MWLLRSPDPMSLVYEIRKITRHIAYPPLLLALPGGGPARSAEKVELARVEQPPQRISSPASAAPGSQPSPPQTGQIGPSGSNAVRLPQRQSTAPGSR